MAFPHAANAAKTPNGLEQSAGDGDSVSSPRTSLCLAIDATGGEGEDSAGSHARGRDIRYVGLALKDGWHILSFPVRWNQRDWQKATVAVIGVMAVTTLDRSVRNWVQRNRTRSVDRVVEVFEPFGAEYAPLLVGGFMLEGIVFNSPRERQVAFDGFVASLVASQNVTLTMKKLFGRWRPYESDEVFRFAPFSGHDSFPSGHTTLAFALAGVIAAHYENRWTRRVAYGSAGMVGLARIVHNVHFASDVVAGAIIGAVVGRSIVRFNRHEQETTRPSSVQLALGPQSGGIGVTLKFVL